MNNLILILSMTALLSACLFPVERASRVAGEIYDENQQVYKRCSIDLSAQIGNELHRLKYMKRPLVFNGASFEHLFVLSTARQHYTIEISCIGTNDIYMSKPLSLDNPVDKPINLGQIILTRSQ